MRNIIYLIIAIFYVERFSFAETCLENTRMIIQNQSGSVVSLQGRNIFMPARVKEYLTNFIKFHDHPKILMGAMEFGTLEIQGKKVTAMSGNLAFVVNDIIKTLPEYLKKKNGEAGLVFMGMKGMPLGEYRTTFEVVIDEKTYKLNLHENILENGAHIFILDHEIFKKRSIEHASQDLYYTDNENYPIFSGREEWEDALILSLFNQGIAHTQKWWGANLYHAHDAQTLLAVKFMDTSLPTTVSIHNADFEKKEIYSTPNFGDQRDYSQGAYPYGVPIGDYETNDQLLKILGFDFHDYMSLTEENGTFNTFKLIHFIEEHNGLAGMPVSQGYERIISREVQAVWDGIDGGLDESHGPQNHPFLAPRTDEEISFISSEIHLKEVRNLWKQDLRFGHNVQNFLGQFRVNRQKKNLKWGTQKTFGLLVNPNVPLFVMIDFKINPASKTNLKTLLDRGAQIVLNADFSQEGGDDLLNFVNNLPKDLKRQISVSKKSFQGELRAMVLGGADFFVMTSPIGPRMSEDLEPIKFGNILVAQKNTGLDQLKNTMIYDIKGEEFSLEKALRDCTTLYFNNFKKFQKMRFENMQEKFSWENVFDHYFDDYNYIHLFKIVKELFNQAKRMEMSFTDAFEIIEGVLKDLPEETKKNYLRILKKRPYRNPIEKQLVKSYSLDFPYGRNANDLHHKLGVVFHSDGGAFFNFWNPYVKSVSLILNDGEKIYPMHKNKEGVWSFGISSLEGIKNYRYRIFHTDNSTTERTDPFSLYVSQGDDVHVNWYKKGPSSWHTVLYQSKFQWKDQDFVPSNRPRFIEIHPGTAIPNRPDANWKDIAHFWAPRLKESKINFVQLMPTQHHNLHESWGYQVGSYFSTNYRHGTPDDLKYFINYMHENGIGVSFDLVMGHFSKDLDTGLANLGTEEFPLFEKKGFMGDHPLWGTKIFDFSKPLTRSFFLSYGRMLVEDFHIDAYRVDAVSSMTNLNFGRNGNFQPNIDGGDLDYDAVSFLQDFNAQMKKLNPNIIAIAEKEQAFSGVTKDWQAGGLGFDFKWEVTGSFFMRKFLKTDPYHRDIKDLYIPLLWDKFDGIYQEKRINFINNHDEASNPGKYFLSEIQNSTNQEKMDWAKLFQGHLSFSLPGRPLVFMGDEVANYGKVEGGDSWSDKNWPNFFQEGLEKDQLKKFQYFFSKVGEILDREPALEETSFKGADILFLDHERKTGVISRFYEKDILICITHASNDFHNDVIIPLPKGGEWKIILNSDDEVFGGSSSKLDIDFSSNTSFFYEEKEFKSTLKINLPPRSYIILKGKVDI